MQLYTYYNSMRFPPISSILHGLPQLTQCHILKILYGSIFPGFWSIGNTFHGSRSAPLPGGAAAEAVNNFSHFLSHGVNERK